jgi:hypothetical protein
VSASPPRSLPYLPSRVDTKEQVMIVVNNANGQGQGTNDNPKGQATFAPGHIIGTNEVLHPTAFNLTFTFHPRRAAAPELPPDQRSVARARVPGHLHNRLHHAPRQPGQHLWPERDSAGLHHLTVNTDGPPLTWRRAVRRAQGRVGGG